MGLFPEIKTSKGGTVLTDAEKAELAEIIVLAEIAGEFTDSTIVVKTKEKEISDFDAQGVETKVVVEQVERFHKIVLDCPGHKARYAINHSTFSAERKAELGACKTPVRELVGVIQKEADDLPAKIDAMMTGPDPPKSITELGDRLILVVNYLPPGEFVDRYVEFRVGKPDPTWKEFEDKYKAVPVEE